MTQLDLSRIGCSDYPTLVGADRYGSLFGLYCRIKGLGEPPRSANLIKRANHGRRFEWPIFEGWCEGQGLEVSDLNVIDNLSRTPEARAWSRYTPDFVVTNIARVVQIKTVSRQMFRSEEWSLEDGNDGVPDRVRLQVIGEIEAMRADADFWRERGIDPMAVEFADVAVCEIQDGEMQDRAYRVPYNDALAKMLVEEAERFWVDHVLADKPPEPDASERCGAVLEMLHPHAADESKIIASKDDDELARSHDQLAKKIKELEAEKSEVRHRLMAKIGDAHGIKGDFWSATWANVAGKTQWESLAQALMVGKSEEERRALQEKYRGNGYRALTVRVRAQEAEEDLF